MKARGDHTITVAWNPPTTQTSKVLSYTVTLAGRAAADGPGRPPPRWRSATSTTTPSTPSRSRRSTRSTTRRRAPPSRSSPWARPRPRARRRSTDLESGVERTSVRVTWPATLPEGPGPTLYTVSYTTPAGTLNVPGCSRVQATTCVHSGIDLRRHHLRLHRQGAQPREHVRAQPARDVPGGRQAGGLGCLVGRPDRRRPAAARGRRRPGPAGQRAARAAILVGGQVVWEGRVAAGQAISQSRPDAQQRRAARRCSCACATSSLTQRGCTLLGRSGPSRRYGPLRREQHPPARPPTSSGKPISWTISGTSNGDPASIRFQARGRRRCRRSRLPAGVLQHHHAAGGHGRVQRASAR